ncbi:MAG: carboxylating nicotinate-nucleotide diphosphorylase [Actinomycetota bacterium]|nr:carboxylating nicotinate-nucleotide diphosphorylase [Actinomycetota bacterium]
MLDINFDQLRDDIRRWLREDVGSGDITTQLTIDKASNSKGTLLAKSETILAGLEVARLVFLEVDPTVEFEALMPEGSVVKNRDRIAILTGSSRSILTGERLGLNLLQHMCAIASTTSTYVTKVAPYGCKIIDTRKTTPGLRQLEKYAVRVGGGFNHRFGLSDGILIKDNHIEAVGSIVEAVRRARMGAPHLMKIEVEVGNLSEVVQALEAGAEAILLDNMTNDEMTRAVEVISKRAIVEASGGMNLLRVEEVAKCGVDLISVGALTHSVVAADISMDFEL